MNFFNLVILAIAAVVGISLFAMLYVAARRRRVLKAQEIAALRHKQTETWERLSHSAAGAP